MRLFVAVLFTPEIIAELSAATDRLRNVAVSGNFTRPENLHLTLAFLGETSRADAIRSAMAKASPKPFTLTLSHFGRFKNTGGDIVWAGLREDSALSDYVERLYFALRGENFRLDERGFKPHITLGREVVLNAPLDIPVNPLSMECRKISLMKSERLGGRICYTEVDSVSI